MVLVRHQPRLVLGGVGPDAGRDEAIEPRRISFRLCQIAPLNTPYRPLTRSRIRNELLTVKSMTLPDVLKSSSMVERERCQW